MEASTTPSRALSILWKVPEKDVAAIAVEMAARETSQNLRLRSFNSLWQAQLASDLSKLLAPDEPEERFRVTTRVFRGQRAYYVGASFGKEVTE